MFRKNWSTHQVELPHFWKDEYVKETEFFKFFFSHCYFLQWCWKSFANYIFFFHQVWGWFHFSTKLCSQKRSLICIFTRSIADTIAGNFYLVLWGHPFQLLGLTQNLTHYTCNNKENKKKYDFHYFVICEKLEKWVFHITCQIYHFASNCSVRGRI